MTHANYYYNYCIIVVIFVLVFDTSTVWSLRCYDCCERADPHCRTDPKRPEFEIDCEHTEPLCYVFKAERRGKKGVMRGCGSEGFCRQLDSSAIKCAVCTTDLCNSMDLVTAHKLQAGGSSRAGPSASCWLALFLALASRGVLLFIRR